jgi:hypothetical protein
MLIEGRLSHLCKPREPAIAPADQAYQNGIKRFTDTRDFAWGSVALT